MKNTNEYEKESLEELEHDLVILLLGFGGFCPFFVPADKATPKAEEANPKPKAKKEPVRSAAELENLMRIFYEARERETTVSIAEMACVMGIHRDNMRKKLNKYPERFEAHNGRVKLV